MQDENIFQLQHAVIVLEPKESQLSFPYH